MPFIGEVILVLIIVGFCLYLAVKYIPMLEPFKQVLMVVVVIALIYWIFSNYHRFQL
jgi:hypothetical protein